MKMRVVDQLHLSAVGPNTMSKGQEFEVSGDLGRDLEKRGLATRVEGGSEAITDVKVAAVPATDQKKKPDEMKAEQLHLNKSETPPENKSEKRRARDDK